MFKNICPSSTNAALFAVTFLITWVSENLNIHAHFDMVSFSSGGGAQNKGGARDHCDKLPENRDWRKLL